MYTPRYYRVEESAELLAFMRKHDFATLFTAQAGAPVATHLPFLVEESEGRVRLVGHMARANPQWKTFRPETEALVVFQGPHAYISPSLYEVRQSVPTWNYAAVHLYGFAKVVEDAESVVVSMIEHYEPSYRQQWDSLGDDYRSKMLNGIVAFEVEATRVEGKYKLSQNRTLNEQLRIMRHLEEQADTGAGELALLMREKTLRDEALR